MFGYVIANKEDLSEEEFLRYRAFYCGLCHALKERRGQLSRLSLTYDLTFLTILLSSLYEPEEKEYQSRCVAHPVKKRDVIKNRYCDYAADMTVALSYYKSLDDWKDDRNIAAYSYGRLLEGEYKDVKKMWPRQCQAVEKSMAQLAEIESQKNGLDPAANSFGELMAELFVCEEDHWSEALRDFGAALGRFIYTMDAVMDYDDDEKHHSYNPLIVGNKRPEDMEELLMIQMGDAAALFEKLPLVQDVQILRSVVYSGVWQKYFKKYKKEQKENDEGSV